MILVSLEVNHNKKSMAGKYKQPVPGIQSTRKCTFCGSNEHSFFKHCLRDGCASEFHASCIGANQMEYVQFREDVRNGKIYIETLIGNDVNTNRIHSKGLSPHYC